MPRRTPPPGPLPARRALLKDAGVMLLGTRRTRGGTLDVISYRAPRRRLAYFVVDSLRGRIIGAFSVFTRGEALAYLRGEGSPAYPPTLAERFGPGQDPTRKGARHVA